ncbi:hypothetical protein IFM5058_01376 [Aspergillus udagawae]|nr:hypothetical protein IFM5058_01376 [Aspergillus udagawae]
MVFAMATTTHSYDDYTVAWICALPLEKTAAVLMLDTQHPPLPKAPSDENSYTFGDIQGHNVVIVCLPLGMYGTNSAAVCVTQMKTTFPSIRCALVVGIGGGAPSSEHDIRLGDVVVSKPTADHGGVIQYDYGKALVGGRFQRTGTLNKPPTVLLNAIAELDSRYQRGEGRINTFLSAALASSSVGTEFFVRPQDQEDLLFRSGYCHADESKSCNACDRAQLLGRPSRRVAHPFVHYGTVASGNQVMKDGNKRQQLSETDQILCFEMEAAGVMDQIPSLVIRGVCDYADSHKNKKWQSYAAGVAAAYGKELLSVVEPQRGGSVKNKKFDQYSEDISFAIQNDLLPYAPQAAFDGLNIHDVCLQNTRVQILREITDWATAPSGSHRQPIFWLNGNAGTGKSTAAKTIAASLARKKKLGGSFFFNIADSQCSCLDLFFTTLANHLIHYQPKVGRRILDAVKNHHMIKKASFESQWGQLILGPVAEADPAGSPIVLVIDALDECIGGRKRHSDILLAMLAELAQDDQVQLRVLISSRPEALRFHRIAKERIHEVNLHYAVDGERDVSYFLYCRLDQIRGLFCPEDKDWPDTEDVLAIQRQGGNLFVYVAAVCRLLRESELDYDRKLKDIARSTNTGVDALFDIYRRILFNAIPSDHSYNASDPFCSAVTLILGTIIVLREPLSSAEIDEFLIWEPPQFPARRIIPLIPSIFETLDKGPMTPETAIRLYHPSFRGFFVHKSRLGQPFWTTAAAAHTYVLRNCYAIMDATLKMDFYGLNDPGILAAEMYSDSADRSLPSLLCYACRSWVYHFLEGNLEYCYEATVQFLEVHFLHWVESMALMGEIADAVSLMTALRDLPTQVSAEGMLIPASNSGPEMCFHSFKWQRGNINQTAISPSGQRVASISNAAVVSYWDLEMGKSHLLEPELDIYHRKYLTSCGDDRLIALNDSGNIIVWDIGAEGPRHIIIEPASRVSGGIIASSSSEILVSSHFQGSLAVWDVTERRQEVHHTVCHDQLERLLFLSDGRLASVSVTTARIWNALTLEMMNEFHYPEIENSYYEISPEGLLAGARDSIIYILDLNTGLSWHCPQIHRGEITLLKLGSNGLLASGSRDGLVCVWNIKTGQPLHQFNIHKDRVYFCDALLNDDFLAMSEIKGQIFVWELSTGVCHLLHGHTAIVTFALSENGRLVSFSGHGHVRIWSCTTWACEVALLDVVSGVDYSALDKQLVISQDRIYATWTYSVFMHDLKTKERKRIRDIDLVDPTILAAIGREELWYCDTDDQGNWIKYGAQRLLCLPDYGWVMDYRVSGNTLAVGYGVVV